jgi:hypothetical protein
MHLFCSCSLSTVRFLKRKACWRFFRP